MRNCQISFPKSLAVFVGLLCCTPVLLAQTEAPQKPANSPAAPASSRAPDLSGNWAIKPGGTSWDPSDPNGSKPEQLPMTP